MVLLLCIIIFLFLCFLDVSSLPILCTVHVSPSVMSLSLYPSLPLFPPCLIFLKSFPLCLPSLSRFTVCSFLPTCVSPSIFSLRLRVSCFTLTVSCPMFIQEPNSVFTDCTVVAGVVCGCWGGAVGSGVGEATWHSCQSLACYASPIPTQ